MILFNVQEYFMDLYLLAELKTISLKITTVDMKRPPADFRSNFEVSHSTINYQLRLYNKMFVGSAASNPDRQWCGSPGEWPHWETHHEEDTWRTQPFCSWSGDSKFFMMTHWVNVWWLQEVNKKIENVYSKFKLMLLKRDDNSKTALTNTLVKWVLMITMMITMMMFVMMMFQDWWVAGKQGNKIPHWRHNVLLRLWTHAQAAAHQSCRSDILRHPVFCIEF